MNTPPEREPHNPQPFCWPDENPPAPGWADRVQGWVRSPSRPRLQAEQAPPAALPPGLRSPLRPPRARVRIRDVVRTRPVPTAVALAIGIGPLAFAAYDAFPDTSDLLAMETGMGDAVVTQPEQTLTVPGTPVWPYPQDAVPAGADPQPADQPPATPAPAEPQWGDPLPSALPGAGVAGLPPSEAGTGGTQPPVVQAPDTPRRASGRVVLASTYWASRGWSAVAEADAAMAVAATEAPRDRPMQRVGYRTAAAATPSAPPANEPSAWGQPDGGAAASHSTVNPVAEAPVATPATATAPAVDSTAQAKEARGIGRLWAWAKSVFAGTAAATAAAPSPAAMPSPSVPTGPAAAVQAAADTGAWPVRSTDTATQAAQWQPAETGANEDPATGARVLVAKIGDAKGAVRERVSSAQDSAGELAKAAAKDLADTVRLVNPFVRSPKVPLVPLAEAGAIVDPMASRALRIAELPSLLSLNDKIPVDERSTAPLPGEALSLEAAVDKGLRRHPDVQAARARHESFQHTARAAFGALLPQAEGRAAVGKGTLSSVTPNETRHRKEGSFTVRQSLLDVAAMREHSRQVTLAQAAELQWQASVSNVSQEIAADYLQALQARITLTLAARHERELARVLEIVTERANGGGTSQAERSRVQARVSSARAQMADARATLRGALRRLSVSIGESPQQLALALPASLDIPLSVDAALQDVEVLNRELLASRTEAKASAFEALGYRARMLPKLELEMTHSRATNPGGAEAYTRDTRAMVVLNWQLYSGGVDMAQQRAALARERERELRGDELRMRLTQDLEAAYASLESVSPRYAALREELTANLGVAAAFNTQLVNGNRPLLDVLDIYQRLHANRLDLAALVLGEVQNHVRVAHMTGRLGATSLQAMNTRQPQPVKEP